MANPIQEARDDAWEAFRQVGGAVAHPPDNAGGQQVGQPTVYGRVRLTENKRQFRRIDERHSAERVEQLSVATSHVLSVAK